MIDALPPNCTVDLDKDSLCREFTEFQVDSELPSPALRVDEYWAAVGRMTDPATSSPAYPLLSRLAKSVLLIPHSNASCEGLFSMVKKITNDQRSSLGRGKEGCSNTSAYQEVHGVRNTLCGLLAGKINIFKDTTCYEWVPSQELFQKAKSATYNALN